MQDLPRPIPPAELNELIRLAQAGDLEARNRAVMANSRLVAKLAEQVCGHDRQQLDDYIQAGIAGHGAGNGLINAIMTYRLECQPHALGTWPAYAKRGVLSAMNALAPDIGRVVTSRRQREKMRRLRKLLDELPPEADPLHEARAAGISAGQIDIEQAQAPLRPSLLVEQGELPEAESALDLGKLAAAMGRLPEDQRAALRKRYGFGRAGGRMSLVEQAAAEAGESALKATLTE